MADFASVYVRERLGAGPKDLEPGHAVVVFVHAGSQSPPATVIPTP